MGQKVRKSIKQATEKATTKLAAMRLGWRGTIYSTESRGGMTILKATPNPISASDYLRKHL